MTLVRESNLAIRHNNHFQNNINYDNNYNNYNNNYNNYNNNYNNYNNVDDYTNINNDDINNITNDDINIYNEATQFDEIVDTLRRNRIILTPGIEDPSRIVHITVKLVYTTITHDYIFPRDATTLEMIQYLRAKIPGDFALSQNAFEIVETGQDVLISEEAPAFIPHDIVSVLNTFDNRNHISFYVRPLIHIEPVQAPIEDADDPQCMVCFEYNLPTLTQYFGCSHHICQTCISGCERANITRCGICRHDRNLL